MRNYIWGLIIASFTVVYVNTAVAVPIPLDLGSAIPINTSTVPVILSDTLSDQNDINLYSFTAFGGDSLTADIDGGYNGIDGFQAGTDIDTILALFDSSGTLLTQNDDLGTPIDDGSFANNPFDPIYTSDPFLTFSIPTTETYYLSVTASANYFDPSLCVGSTCGYFTGDGLSEFNLGGGYTVILSGITPVPEPPTLLLFVFGLATIILTMYIKRPLRTCLGSSGK